MSRIGKAPIPVPAGVEVRIGEKSIEVKGPKGQLSTPLGPGLIYALADGQVSNCIVGVTQGFSILLEVVGVGYRVAVKGQSLELALGFSHPVLLDLPAGISAKAEGNKLTISGADKELVGETAARIRRLRKPEPYKGKGIKYENERIRRKVGKSGTKK